jgi:hypothetical protein
VSPPQQTVRSSWITANGAQQLAMNCVHSNVQPHSACPQLKKESKHGV